MLHVYDELRKVEIINITRVVKYICDEYMNMSTGTHFTLILWFAYMLSYEESKSTTSNLLLSMNTLSTSNFEYDIKISMNVYKY